MRARLGVFFKMEQERLQDIENYLQREEYPARCASIDLRSRTTALLSQSCQLYNREGVLTGLFAIGTAFQAAVWAVL